MESTMTTFHRRRRYHRDPGMQMLGGLILVVGTLLFALLIGVALADWLTNHDTIATIARGVTR
mgnify:CR=1 FL=1